MPKAPAKSVAKEIEQAVQEDLRREEEREEAVSNLCDSVRNLLSKTDTEELEVLHHIGVQLVEAKNQDLYGPKITKEVAAKLSTYKQKIQFAVRFAEAYDESGFDELKEHKTASGDLYVWSPTHVRFLLRVKNESERASLAKECAKNNWTCRYLQSEVKAIVSGNTPVDVESSANISLTKQLTLLHNFYTKWSDFILQQAKDNTNVADRITALRVSGETLSERQRSLLSSIKSMAPAFTEHACAVNVWLEHIDMEEVK